MKRPKAKTKVTKNGRIMGRPSGDAAPGFARVDPPVKKVRLAAKAPPRAVTDPETGEAAAAHGPPRPIYEEREGAKGRWGRTTSDDTLWQIRVRIGRDRPGYAEKLARELVESGERRIVDVAAVKRKLARTRAEMEARATKLATPRKVPRGISDIPPD